MAGYWAALPCALGIGVDPPEAQTAMSGKVRAL